MTNFKSILPENAYDVKTVAPYVVAYKTPNTYAQKGYMADKRFAATDLARDLAKTLGDEWKGGPFSDDDSPVLECARLTKGRLNIVIRIRSYGANAYNKITFSGFYRSADHRNVGSIEIGVSAKKDLTAIARDVSRRILPGLAGVAADAEKADRAKNEEIRELSKKADSLARKYDNLKISSDADSMRILISTKYGPGAHVHGYVRKDSKGVWGLIADSAFRLDDIDAKQSRAILRAVNAS